MRISFNDKPPEELAFFSDLDNALDEPAEDPRVYIIRRKSSWLEVIWPPLCLLIGAGMLVMLYLCWQELHDLNRNVELMPSTFFE